jgi:gamma-butyrobetaine dioxygenase
MTVRDWRWWHDAVALTWDDGHTSEYPAVWLRDNDPTHRDARTGQRVVDIASLPLEPVIAHAAMEDARLRLEWDGASSTNFSLDWLLANCPCSAHAELRPRRTWTAADHDVCRRFPYESVTGDAASRLAWLETVSSCGIAFLANVPAEEGKVEEVAALAGWIRETNYGRIFDVRAIPVPNNLAYTNRGLGLHTDNPYREPVPGLQMLHCLRTGGEGGASLFADGFAVAEVLRSTDPDAFNLLALTPVRFTFRDADAELSAERPILQLDGSGQLEAIHYNSRSIAPLRMAAEKMLGFYKAYAAFARLLADPRYVLTTTLAPRELVFFDNRRVLHGRTGFSSAEPRHLQGCYLDHDGLRSHIAVLKRNGHR